MNIFTYFVIFISQNRIFLMNIFMLLFRVEFHEAEELAQQDKFYLDDIEKITDEERIYIQTKTDNIIAKIPELDARLEEISKGWKLNRIGKVELTILRLAMYEIWFDEDIPTNVAINEAVELTKTFGGDTSPSFVNGVLGNLIKEA